MAASFNYFNYFTEIEEHFWRKRGASILVSPLDWAIVETWQKAGIPLEAVLRGIDRAFESYARSRRGASGRTMKSLAYCVDAVLDAAEEAREAAAGAGPIRSSAPSAQPFSRDELRQFFQRNRERLESAAQHFRISSPDLAARCSEISRSLGEMLPLLESPAVLELEDLERRLTILEEKLFSALVTGAPDEVQLSIRREMDRALSPYRRKMTADQLALLERQYMQKRLLEYFDLPRLSLFYVS